MQAINVTQDALWTCLVNVFWEFSISPNHLFPWKNGTVGIFGRYPFTLSLRKSLSPHQWSMKVDIIENVCTWSVLCSYLKKNSNGIAWLHHLWRNFSEKGEFYGKRRNVTLHNRSTTLQCHFTPCAVIRWRQKRTLTRNIDSLACRQ